MTDKITEQLQPYLEHPSKAISVSAHRIADLAVEVANGNLSESEFEELANDVVDAALAVEHADDIVNAANIEHTARTLIQLIPQIANALR
jgi:hypothetical protein